MKETLRALTPKDEIAIVWDDSPQSHFVIHFVEDLALEMWDISDGLIALDEDIMGMELDKDELHDELLETMGKFVDLMCAFVANAVMDSLGQAVAEHIMMAEEDSDKRDFNPFKDLE